MIYVIASLRIRPGTLAEVIAAATPCLTATRKEAGCLSYDLSVDVADPQALVFVERWESRAALAAHFEAPHLIAWREAGSRFITDRSVEIIHAGEVERR